ncbi:MAG TPA: uroporphyrinogen-III C-methyltransferase, partial [Chryseolinea sp.]
QAHGKSGTPAAIIQNGTLPTQRLVTGTVSDIAAKASLAGIGSPAIMVVGEVVQHARALAAVTQEVATHYQ